VAPAHGGNQVIPQRIRTVRRKANGKKLWYATWYLLEGAKLPALRINPKPVWGYEISHPYLQVLPLPLFERQGRKMRETGCYLGSVAGKVTVGAG